MTEKEQQEASLIGRIVCLEAFLCLMGLVSLVSGIMTGEPMQLFWGGTIIVGSVVLHFVRKKDWKKHWEEQDLMRQAILERQERLKREKEKEKEGKS